jgi:hypothetical protein
VVAPPVAQPNVPPQGPPQGGPPASGGLPPQIAQIAGTLGVPPEALAQALAPLAQRLAQAGVNPGVLLDFLTTIPPQGVAAFLSAPPQEQIQALADFVQRVQSGQVGPPSAPPPGADLNQPMMGPPPGAGPGAGAPAGPAMMPPTSPPGPPSPAPGALPPNVTPIEAGRRKREQGQPAAEREPPPPDDVELPDLEDLAGDSPYWKDPPSPAQVRRDAWLGRQRWRADHEFVFDQVAAYRMFKDYFGADGRPLRPGLGEVQYKLASFARMVDRAASQAEPRPDEEVLEIPPRAEDRDTKQRTQKAENLLRTRDERERAWWNRRTSRGLVEPPIRTKKFRLLALEGSYAVLYRLNVPKPSEAEMAGRKPLRKPDLLFTREPLSVTEVFPLAHATTVQRRMTFAEACAAEPAVLEQVKKRAKRRGKDFDPEDSSWGVSERTTVCLGEWYDADGLHRLVYWEWGSPATVGADLREPSEGGEDFFIAKARLDWGFCPVQLCPPWNADPSPEGKRGRGAASATARDIGANAGPTRRRYVGAGGKELETQDWKDRIASVMLTTLIGNQHPNVTRTVDPAMVAAGMHETDAGGRPIIPAYLSGPGQQNVVYGGLEKLVVTDRNVSGGSDAALAINILGGESQDAQPAVLGGRGPATSGFETMQRNDAAQSLHVEPMRRAYEDFETYLRGLDLELYLRAGDGDGKLWDELPFRGAVMGAPGNEGTIDVSDLKRAGTYATVTISADDPVAELQKNRIHLERLKSDVESPITVMRELGIKDPDEEQNLIVEWKSIGGNPKLQDALSARALRNIDWDLFLAYMASTSPGPGQQGAGGQPGTPPGAPGAQMAPAPGVPSAGLPSVMG